MQGNLDRYRTIMDSMTAWEKNEPAKIKADRIRRVARGAGVREKDVRELIAQWNRSRKMMKGMGGNRKLNKQMRKMMKEGDMDIDPSSLECEHSIFEANFFLVESTSRHVGRVAFVLIFWCCFKVHQG